jgi:hypothetical protein
MKAEVVIEVGCAMRKMAAAVCQPQQSPAWLSVDVDVGKM